MQTSSLIAYDCMEIGCMCMNCDDKCMELACARYERNAKCAKYFNIDGGSEIMRVCFNWPNNGYDEGQSSTTCDWKAQVARACV